MTDCLLHIAAHIKPVIEYSAWYFQRMGQYQECVADPEMRYNFVSVAVENAQADAGFVALCLPKICTKEEIEMGLNKVFQTVQYPIKVHEIQNDIPSISYPFSWVFYLTIIIAISCILLVIYASLIKKPATILSAFSIQQTLKTFSYNPTSPLNILNGVRSLSMMWVIIGHAYTNMLIGVMNIQSSVEKESFEKPFYLFIQAGIFAVDVFFFIAGLLLAWVFLKDKTEALSKYPLAILQRVLRLWPSYIFAMMVYYSVYVHMGSGPMWGSDQNLVSACGNMWKSIFFVDNFVDNGETPCMNWGWYLQNDMQLFVFSVGLLFIYRLKPIVMKVIIWPMMVGSMVFTFLWTFKHGVFVTAHMSDIDRWGTFFADVYSKPWARCPPYLLGVFFGVLHYEYEQSKRNINSQGAGELMLGKISRLFNQKKMVRILCEWLGIGVLLFLIFIPRTLQTGMEWPQWLHSLYGSTAKFIFVQGLYLTLLPSLLGNRHSIIRLTLDTRFFNFIAKVSFCTYLIHLTLIETWIYSRTYSQYYTNVSTWTVFCGLLVVSVGCGFVMTVGIEAPCSRLQKGLVGWVKGRLVQGRKERIVETEKLEHYKKLDDTILTEDSGGSKETISQ